MKFKGLVKSLHEDHNQNLTKKKNILSFQLISKLHT